MQFLRHFSLARISSSPHETRAHRNCQSPLLVHARNLLGTFRLPRGDITCAFPVVMLPARDAVVEIWHHFDQFRPHRPTQTHRARLIFETRQPIAMSGIYEDCVILNLSLSSHSIFA